MCRSTSPSSAVSRGGGSTSPVPSEGGKRPRAGLASGRSHPRSRARAPQWSGTPRARDVGVALGLKAPEARVDEDRVDHVALDRAGRERCVRAPRPRPATLALGLALGARARSSSSAIRLRRGESGPPASHAPPQNRTRTASPCPGTHLWPRLRPPLHARQAGGPRSPGRAANAPVTPPLRPPASRARAWGRLVAPPVRRFRRARCWRQPSARTLPAALRAVQPAAGTVRPAARRARRRHLHQRPGRPAARPTQQRRRQRQSRHRSAATCGSMSTRDVRTDAMHLASERSAGRAAPSPSHGESSLPPRGDRSSHRGAI